MGEIIVRKPDPVVSVLELFSSICRCCYSVCCRLGGQASHVLSNNAAHSAYDTYVAAGPVAETEVTAAQQLFSGGDYKKAARNLEAAVKLEPARRAGSWIEFGRNLDERLAEGSAFPSLDQRRAEGPISPINGDRSNRSPGPCRYTLIECCSIRPTDAGWICPKCRS